MRFTHFSSTPSHSFSSTAPEQSAGGRRATAARPAVWVICAAVVVLATPDASGQVFTWTGATNSSFTTTTNWSGGVVPTTSGSTTIRYSVNGATNPLTYTATQGYTILNPADRALVIGSAVNGAMVITGGTLQLGGNNESLISNNATGSLTINGGTLLSGTQNLSIGVGGSGVGTLTVTSGIANIYRLRVNTTQSAIINADGGTLALGAMQISLTPATTFQFNFNGGTVQATENSASWFGSTTGTFTNVRDGGAIIDTNGFNVTVGMPLRKSTIGGDAAIDGGLRKLNSGTLTLSGSNSYTGLTSISGGVLSLGNANALAGGGNITFSGGGLQFSGSNTADYGSRIKNSGSAVLIDTNAQSVTFAGNIDNTNTAGLVKTGAGTLILAGSANAYAGNTTVSSGTLQIGDGSAATGSLPGNVLLTNTSGLSFNSSSDQTYAGFISGTGRLTKAGAGTLTLSAVGNVVNQGLTLTSGGILNSGSISMGGATLSSGTFTNTATGQVQATGDVNLGGASLVNSGTFSQSGYRNISVSGSSSIVNSGAMNWGGWFYGSGSGTGGELTTFTNNAGGSLGTGDTSWGGAKFIAFTNAGGSYNVTTGMTIGRTNGSTATGTTSFTVASGTVTAGSGGAISLSVSGTVSNATIDLNLNGGQFASGTSINGSITSTGTGNAVRVNFDGGTLRGSRTNQTLLPTTLSSVTLNAGGGTIELGSGIINTITANMSGVGGLTKTGSGTLILAGAGNTYAGNTTVSTGTLQIGDGSSATGSLPGNVLLSNTSGLAFASTANQSYAGMITGTGNLTKAGAGSTLTLSGVGSAWRGTLTVNSSALTNTGSITLTAPAYGQGLDVSGTSTFTNSGFFSTNQRITVSPGGLLTNSGTVTSSEFFVLSTGSAGNSGNMNNGGFFMGGGSTDSGVARFTNTNVFSGGDFQLNNANFSVFTNNGGSANFGNNLPIGKSAGTATGTSALIVNSGTVTAGSNGFIRLDIANGVSNATAEINLNGGLFIANRGITASVATGTAGSNNAARVNFAGGTLRGTLNNATLLGTDLTSVDLNAGGGTIDLGSGITNTIAAPVSGIGGLTKTGVGILVLSGSNGFTGLTTISAGSIEFGSINALRNSSGVNIVGGGSLRYTGGAASFDRNISVTSGTGTVTNSGGGLLTLAGTLTKDGTVLRLTGGQFNVTGQIVGASANSDLLVDGTSTVTLSNANSYNGPTFVNQASNLIVVINNAIPSNSVVTLGNATTTGTLTLGSNSNAIGGLAFGAGGGTLRVTANSTGAAQLTAASGTLALANGTLDLAGSGTTAGLYRVLSAQSITGALSGTTGLNSAYRILATGSTLDLQQRSVLSSLSITNTTTSIITGGAAAFTYSVANGAASGGQSLSFTGTGLSNIGGSSAGTASAGGSSSPVSGLSFTGTAVGLGQAGTFTVSDPAAFGTTSLTGTVTVNVLNHSLASFAATDTASKTLNFGTYQDGVWTGGDGGNGTLGYSIFNIASLGFTNAETAGLDLYEWVLTSGNGSAFSLGSSVFQNLAAGSSNGFSASVNSPGSLADGPYTATYTLRFRDQQNLSGAANTRDLSITLSANVIAVPEPGAMALAGIGIAAAAYCIRRRK